MIETINFNHRNPISFWVEDLRDPFEARTFKVEGHYSYCMKTILEEACPDLEIWSQERQDAPDFKSRWHFYMAKDGRKENAIELAVPAEISQDLWYGEDLFYQYLITSGKIKNLIPFFNVTYTGDSHIH